MGIVLFGHAGVGVAQMLGHDRPRDAPHREGGGVGMAKHQEKKFRLDLRSPTRLKYGPQLVRPSPSAAIGPGEDWLSAEFAGSQGGEKPLPFFGQHYVPRLTSLALAHGDNASISVEVGSLQCGKFRIA